MRLLFLTPQMPFPPQQGTALRNWGLISRLAGNHEVWLLTFDERSADQPIPNEVRRACKEVMTVPVPARTTTDRLRTLASSPLPDMAWRLWSPAFQHAFNMWLRDHHFDIVQVEGIELARYLIDAQSAPIPRNAQFVFDDHNCEYILQKRTHEADLKRGRMHGAAYSYVQWQRLHGFERDAMVAADATLAVSPQDAAMLKQLAPSKPVDVIFNGIDVASYGAFAALALHKTPTVIFTGKMDFRPNIEAMLWFAREAWPAIKAAIPPAQLRIVGQKPSPRLDPLRNDPDIIITGQVEDVRPHIAAADVYIAPLLAGGGTRFKLLEAMAMRKAIVTTTLGREGFDVQPGREMMIADTGSHFAGAVIELLRSEGRRQQLGERAFTFVSATYDWKAIVPNLEQVYRRLKK
jgi:glycosyltransferase involved in cell wall biosynthesis